MGKYTTLFLMQLVIITFATQLNTEISIGKQLFVLAVFASIIPLCNLIFKFEILKTEFNNSDKLLLSRFYQNTYYLILNFLFQMIFLGIASNIHVDSAIHNQLLAYVLIASILPLSMFLSDSNELPETEHKNLNL